MPLFEVAVIQKPTKKEAEDGTLEKLVFGPTTVIAKDSQSAIFAAGAKLDPSVDLGRAEVLVRPF